MSSPVRTRCVLNSATFQFIFTHTRRRRAITCLLTHCYCAHDARERRGRTRAQNAAHESAESKCRRFQPSRPAMDAALKVQVKRGELDVVRETRRVKITSFAFTHVFCTVSGTKEEKTSSRRRRLDSNKQPSLFFLSQQHIGSKGLKTNFHAPGVANTTVVQRVKRRRSRHRRRRQNKHRER